MAKAFFVALVMGVGFLMFAMLVKTMFANEDIGLVAFMVICFMGGNIAGGVAGAIWESERGF